MSAAKTESCHGLLAEFPEPEALVRAIKELRDQGYERVDGYSPYPIEGLAEALHFRPWPVSLIFLICGVGGAAGGFLMQYYCSVIAYPENIGGRPLNSWPSFIPVTFEMGILAGVLGGIFGMLVLNRLPRYSHPISKIDRFRAATSDAFFLCVEASDSRFQIETTRLLLGRMGATEITEVES